jgi:hypothetical protein
MIAPPKPGFLPIHIATTPSPSDPPGADTFYWFVGVATVALGRLEGHFVSCLMMIIQIAKDNKIGTKLPMKWEKREKMWADAFRSVASLKFLEAEATAFIKAFNDLAGDRNLMAHCLWETFRPDLPLAMDVLNIKAVSATPDGVSFQRTSISVDSLANVATIANNLNVRLLQISQALAALQGPPPSDFRKL